MNTKLNSGGNTINKTPEDLQKEYDTLKAKTGKTADDFKKLAELQQQLNSLGQKSLDDLTKDLQQAENDEDREKAAEIQKQIDDLQKSTPSPQKQPLEEIKDIINKIRTKQEKKDQIMKLLEAHQRDREEKNKDLGKKPQDKMLGAMYNKLMDYDKDLKQPDFKEGIDTSDVKSGLLPFIPTFKRKGKEKTNGVSSYSLGTIEVLNWSARKRRNKINRVANELNNIGNDSEKAIRYIFNMSRKRSGGRPGALLKQTVRSRIDAKKLLTRDPAKFMEQFKEQKEKFLDAITDGDETEDVKKTMEVIKSWIDYHVSNYKVQQAQKWLN